MMNIWNWISLCMSVKVIPTPELTIELLAHNEAPTTLLQNVSHGWMNQNVIQNISLRVKKGS